MFWKYADRYSELMPSESMQIEALVKIAEQLEQINRNLKDMKDTEMKVNVRGGVNTHSY